MLKNSPVVPTFTNLNAAKCPGVMRVQSKLNDIFGSLDNWPPILQELRAGDEDLALQSLGLAIVFLDDALITAKTIKPGTFKRYTPET